MDDEFEGLRFKQVSKDSTDLNFFNNYDTDLPPFDFDYEHKRDNLFFKDLTYETKEMAPRSVAGGKLEQTRNSEVKKSISYGNLNNALKSKKKINRAESCINLQELKAAAGGKKPNSKNIFIQKIHTLLKDNNLLDKIEHDNK